MFISIMKTFFLCIAVVAVHLIAIFPAHAKKEPLVLEPSSKWILNYDDNSCILGRSFGEGENKILFIMKLYQPNGKYAFTLAGKLFEQRYSPVVVDIQFGPNEKEREVRFFAGKHGENSPALISRGGVRIVPYTDEEIEAVR